MKRLLALFAIHCSLFTLSAAVQPTEMPPFTFAGRIVDYAHVAYDGDTVVEVRVKAQDGTLLAKTKTATGGETAYNYAVDVPVSDKTISGHVKAGDEVMFEFVDPDGVVYAGLVAADKAIIGKPGEYRKVDVILATDADKDGVADEYVDTLSYLMWVNGKESYDANADWDGDGQSNYQEYVAGTNPFDKTDKFSVGEMAEEKGKDGYMALRVMVNQGRTYTVAAADELKPGADGSSWMKVSFAVEDPSAGLQGRLSTGPSEVGYRTIYVRKDAAQKFLKLEVE